MATLKQIRQKMLEMAPELGSVETPASGSATTVVVSRLASGTLSAQKYANRWLLRPDASGASAAADRAARIVTNFASSTGTLTHAGANYVDQTFTSEDLEIHTYDPQRLDRAIAYAVGTIRALDMDLLACVPNKQDYDLGAFSWIQEEDDILGVGHRGSPVLSRNRGFEKWAEMYTPTLDHWTLAGSAATLARSSSPRTGKYAATITRAGTNVTLTQTVGLMDTGASGDSLRGQACTLVLVSKSSTANHVRAAVADGTQTVTTDYHSGSGAWEEDSNTITIASTATTLTIQIQVNTSDAAADVDDCYLMLGGSHDTARRDFYPVSLLNRDEWEWADTRPSLRLPARGRKGQYVVYSARPVPTFQASDIAGGLADADTVDVPVDTAAIAALARFYRGLAGHRNENTTREGSLAAYWEQQRQMAQAKMLVLPGRPPRSFGINVQLPVMAPAASR